MKSRYRRTALWVLLLLVCPFSVLAQQATTNRNVILRRDPATTSPALEHLAKGDRLMLVDANADSGFYHVRTEDDQVGWVLSKYVSLSPTPPSPALATPTAASGETCDPTLEAHVYHPQRLIVKQPCIAVTGTIVDATATETVKQPDGVRHEKDRVKLPPVGAHVRIVGRYVQDTFHAKWNEIHPVTSITVVP